MPIGRRISSTGISVFPVNETKMLEKKDKYLKTNSNSTFHVIAIIK